MSTRTTKLSTTEIRLVEVELQVVKGPDKGLRAPLTEPLTLGTSAGCNVPLSDETVSGRHCEFARHGTEVVVRDLGSTNGVFVDDVRVREALPKLGSKIRLGQTTVVLKSLGETEVLSAEVDRFGPVIGSSGAMRQLFAQLSAVADSDAPVLLEGETGTGKDLTAQAIHEASARAKEPLCVFDCGAIADSLIEAELFGYERGAFTGANAARVGLAESADGGTLLLDEIGELPLALQPKLLRLLESKTVRRVGSNASRPVDLRIIAATNRVLKHEVEAGRFRQDLYFRLSTLRIRLPSLRERAEDIPGLVDHLLAKAKSSTRFHSLPEGTQHMLLSHHWPGNVRELRNVIERLVVFPSAPLEQLFEDGAGPHANKQPVKLDLNQPLLDARREVEEAFEKRYLEELLRTTENMSAAARRAGISRPFLYRLLARYGLK